jgi:hypothetical protein
MRSSVLLLPLLVLAFQSHQTTGRGEISLKPVTAAGWRGLLPVSGLDPHAADDPSRPECLPPAGLPDAGGAAPNADPRPADPGRRSALSRVAATDLDGYTPPFLSKQAVDSAGVGHRVSS